MTRRFDRSPWQLPWWVGTRTAHRWCPGIRRPARRRQARVLRPDRPGWRARLVIRAPRRTAVALAGCAAVAFLVIGGPVAAVLAATYAAIAVLATARRARSRGASRAVAQALDALAGLAADLRAGVRPADALATALPALPGSTPDDDSGPAAGWARSDDGGPGPVNGVLRGGPGMVDDVARLASRVTSAWQVAEATGAPLADLLDRVETDARTLIRVRIVAEAHAAGTVMTAWLLAGLPVAGITVGYGMGADPLRVLLRTPIGAVCAGAALLCQVGGLAWAGRLARAGEVDR